MNNAVTGTSYLLRRLSIPPCPRSINPTMPAISLPASRQPVAGKERRASGREYVFYDHHSGPGGLFVFDVVPRTVLLAFFANDASVDHRVTPLRRKLNDGGNQKVGANREPPDRGGLPRQTIRCAKQKFGDRPEHAALEHGALAVEVEAGLLARTQDERAAGLQEA